MASRVRSSGWTSHRTSWFASSTRVPRFVRQPVALDSEPFRSSVAALTAQRRDETPLIHVSAAQRASHSDVVGQNLRLARRVGEPAIGRDQRTVKVAGDDHGEVATKGPGLDHERLHRHLPRRRREETGEGNLHAGRRGVLVQLEAMQHGSRFGVEVQVPKPSRRPASAGRAVGRPALGGTGRPRDARSPALIDRGPD